jgi:hypothetical protein
MQVEIFQSNAQGLSAQGGKAYVTHIPTLTNHNKKTKCLACLSSTSSPTIKKINK